jgi:hypothetical protein
VATGERVITELQSDRRFEVNRIPNGTNIFGLRVKGASAEAYRQRAQDAGVALPAPSQDQFLVSVNETWNRANAPEILGRLTKALG